MDQLPFRNLRVLELLIGYADSAYRPDDIQGQLFHRMLLDGDIIAPSTVAVDEYVPTDLGEAWLQALIDVPVPHRTRPKGLPIDPPDHHAQPGEPTGLQSTRDRALELAIRASDDSLDGNGIVAAAVIFEAYLLAGSPAAATVPPAAASSLEVKLDEILWWIEHQQEEVSHMAAAITAVQAAIAALSAKVASESSVIDSAVALIEGFKDRISALITPRTDPDTVAEINHLLDTVGAESDKLATAVAAGTVAGMEVDGKLDGTNGTPGQNADYARGVADRSAGKAPGDVPPEDQANAAYADGYFAAGPLSTATASGNPAAAADPGVDPGPQANTVDDTIVPPSTVPPDAPADAPTPETVAGPDEQPPAPPVDGNAGSV